MNGFFSKYTIIYPMYFNALYWKICIALLCSVFADPVTNLECSWLNENCIIWDVIKLWCNASHNLYLIWHPSCNSQWSNTIWPFNFLQKQTFKFPLSLLDITILCKTTINSMLHSTQDVDIKFGKQGVLQIIKNFTRKKSWKPVYKNICNTSCVCIISKFLDDCEGM